MDDNQLDDFFLRTIDDLRARRDSRDEYELTRAAALLRQLLTDGNPLVPRLASRHRVTPVFTVTKHAGFGSAGSGIRLVASWVPGAADAKPADLERYLEDQIRAHPQNYDRLSLEDFLAEELLRGEGHTFTVKSLIRYFSHVEGGVHLGHPKLSEHEDVLQRAARRFALQGEVEMGHRFIEDIARVTIPACEPIRNAILAPRRVAVRSSAPRSKS